MDTYTLNAIPFHLDRDVLARQSHIRPGSQEGQDLLNLIDEMESFARPKAIYKSGFIESRNENLIIIDGIQFRSQVLTVNLENVHRVFAFLATCGTELAKIRARQEDFLRQFWADAIMELALRAAMEAIHADLSTRFQLGPTSTMNPGSLEDWPISQQIPFFDLLGPEARNTGVQLTESLLMVPAKSVTGLTFETNSGFSNCQLCPRQICPNRQAEFDPDLMEEKYQRDR